MKVTMVVRNSIWFDPRVRRAAESAQSAGIDVTVVGLRESRFDQRRIDELEFPTIIVDADLSLNRGDISIFKKLKREYYCYARAIKACIETDPDVIHANDLDALPIAFIASVKTKAGVVFDSHEIFCENDEIRKSKVRYFVWKNIERYMIKRVHAVVSVSHAAANKLSEIYGIDNITVVTNAAKLTPNDALLPKKEGKFEVLTQGKFYAGRGYDTFVRTASILSQYKDIDLIIRGFGPLEHELHKIANENKIGNNLIFEPPILVTEMVKYASRSHVGVAITEPININFINTVSNKLFEYINAGLPVIMSDVPEHRYINDKYNIGLILDYNTPECLAKAIITLYEDKLLYGQLAQNAFTASKLLNWESEFEKLAEIYDQANRKTIHNKEL